MANPYAPKQKAEKVDAPNPTLDLDPTKGAELTESLPTPDTGGNSVPDGNIKEVLDWVDGDKDRARAAVDAEKRSDDPRPTLIHKLKKVIEG